MRAALLDLAPSKPREVYVIACRLELKTEAKSAASIWLKDCPKVYSQHNSSGTFPDWSKTTAAETYIPEMVDISAGAYFRLLRFIHDECDSNFVHDDLRDQDRSETVYRPILRPFDFEDADIVLRTSDGVDFRVHKVIISLISSNLLDNESTMHDGLPIFNIPENGPTLLLLLEFCYPNGNPDDVI
jgi:hypothetical protein